MIAEVEVLLHVDDVVQVVLVFPLYDVQNLQLDQSLVMEPARLKWKGRLAINFLDFFFFLISRHRIPFLYLREKINSSIFSDHC